MPPYKIPKRVKHRKEFRRVRDRKATKGNYVAFGDYGLQALEGCWLKSNQIEAGRIACQHFLKREGKLFIRVFPDKPVSKKAARDANGQGQGGWDYWAACVKEGTILHELAGVSEVK
ncbi:MAG: 50S ribosomal protein L16 [Phycisphaerales bacterium]